MKLFNLETGKNIATVIAAAALTVAANPALASQCMTNGAGYYQTDAKSEKAEKYLAKADKYEARGDLKKAEYYRTKAAKYASKSSSKDKSDKVAKYLAKADEYEARGNLKKAEYYRAKAAKYAGESDSSQSKAEKYAAKAEQRALEGDLDKSRYYAAKAKKYADKYEAGCWPTVGAEFSADDLMVNVDSTKDLSNVVLLYSDGSVEKYDSLSGHELSFMGVGDNDGKTLSGVWIKSGCNHSGDGPGYGEFVANEHTVTFIPVVSISDNPVILENEYENIEAMFTVSLSEMVPDGAVVRVDYMTVEGSAFAAEDFVFETATLEFLPGEISKTVSITVVGDESREAPENFHVDLLNPFNATLGQSRGTGTIYDIRDDY